MTCFLMQWCTDAAIISFYSMYVMHEKERNVKDVRLKQAVVSKMKHIARQPNANIDDCELLANAVQYIYLVSTRA
jgi:hypothetical protein